MIAEYNNLMNAVMKWNFIFFCHDYDVVDVVENQNKTFFPKTKSSGRISEIKGERSTAWDSDLFSLWNVVSVLAAVMT